MKAKHFLMTLAAAAMVIGLGACSKDDTNNDKPKPEPEPEKSSEAKILTFKATAGDITIEGKILGENNDQIQLVGLYDDIQAMKAATAVVTISDKATISPDPAQEQDYTKAEGVQYTVTAEDGTTTKTYTVKAVEAQVNLKVEKVWEKTPNDLGLPESKINDCGVAFSGKNIVTYDCSVYDLDGNKVGTLNTTGLANTKLISMTNDDNGVLIASVADYQAGAEIGDTDRIQKGYIWVWKNGWDQAPELLLQNDGDFTRFISITGDVNGDALFTLITGGRTATPPQMHHCYEVKGGNWAGAQWHAFSVNLPTTDGSWSQMISPCSTDINGYFLIFDSQNTASSEEKESGIYKGEQVFARHGINGSDVNLKGTLWDDGNVAKQQHGGDYQYGNHTLGHVRGFRINGQDYGIVSTSGFTASFFTVQPVDPSKDYLLRTLPINETVEAMVCSAYLFDKENNCAEMIFMSTNFKVLRYRIVVELI